MPEASPTVRRRRLGLVLRGLRERAGLTGEEAGSAIERSGSWVSRVETGRVGLRGRDLADLLELYGVRDDALREELRALAREGKQRGWWSKYADALSGPYATYIGFESEAAELLVYEAIVVPSLLQTDDYARAALKGAAIPPHTPEMIERRTNILRSRQEAVARRAEPVAVCAILDESILHRRTGGAAVLRGQLEHLLEAARLPSVAIHVLAFDAGHNPGMIGSFTVIRFPFPQDQDVAYVEGATGDVFAESDDAHSYRRVFQQLKAASLSPAESRRRIERASAALA